MKIWNSAIKFEFHFELDGEALRFCVADTKKHVFVLLKTKSGHQLIEYYLCQKEVTRSWKVKGNAVILNATMDVSPDGKFLVLHNECQPKELEIIHKAGDKCNMKRMEGCTHKFMCLDLSKEECAWKICNKILTKIPMLGYCWDFIGPSTVLLARDRVSVEWDLVEDKCDQQLVKGTKTPRFFRPSWLENDKNWGTVSMWCIYV